MNMLNIGKTGLLASAASLNTVSNNVANAMVDGYSRQEVLTSSVGNGANGGGNGVNIDGVRRISDQYQVSQVWKSNSNVGYSQIQTTYLGQVERVFGAEGNDVSKGLSSLFASMNSAMEQPNLISKRQGILNDAKALTQRINSISETLAEQQHQIKGQMGISAEQVNTYLEGIVKFNKDIRTASSQGVAPAALKDSRDGIIGQLATLMDIRVTEDNQGLVTITLRQGEPLVSGTSRATLVTSPDPAKPGNSNIDIQFGTSHFALEENAGGSLGSLINYRDNELAKSQAYLDEVATHVAKEFNTVLKAGTDLNGVKPTKDLFTLNKLNPASSLSINRALSPEELALGKDGTKGDNSNLKELVKLDKKPLAITSLATTTNLAESFSARTSELGSASRQAIVDSQTNTSLQKSAKAHWASTSGVNTDEEGINLLIYNKAYQANAKVIGIAQNLFSTLLQSF